MVSNIYQVSTTHDLQDRKRINSFLEDPEITVKLAYLGLPVMEVGVGCQKQSVSPMYMRLDDAYNDFQGTILSVHR